MAVYDDISRSLNTPQSNIIFDIVESLAKAPALVGKRVARLVQSQMVNSEVVKASYHSITLLIEVMYNLYRANSELLVDDWNVLVEFSSTIYTSKYCDPLCLKNIEGTGSGFAGKEDSKLVKQLREYTNLNFLLVVISAWPLSDRLTGYKDTACKSIKEFYSASVEIAGHLLTSLGDTFRQGASSRDSPSFGCWMNMLNVYSALVQMLDQKNLESESAEVACTNAFTTTSLVFQAANRAMKADPKLITSLAIPIAEVINSICSSKIAGEHSDFTPMLEEYLDLIDILRQQHLSDDQESTLN